MGQCTSKKQPRSKAKKLFKEQQNKDHEEEEESGCSSNSEEEDYFEESSEDNSSEQDPDPAMAVKVCLLAGRGLHFEKERERGESFPSIAHFLFVKKSATFFIRCFHFE